ncbi:hypothetical protein AB4262_18760, partial [Vibrio breoganii]
HCGALKLEVAQIRTQTEQIRTVKHLIAELRQRMQTPANMFDQMPNELLETLFRDMANPHN